MTGRYRAYPEYKDSGVEWLGEVPTEWKTSRIKFFAALNPSKSELNTLSSDTEVTFLPMEAIGEQGSLDTSKVRKLRDVINGYTYIREGDVCVAKITPCFENGKGAIAKGLRNDIGFATTEVIPLRCARRRDAKYVYYLLTSAPFNKQAEGSMYGAGGQKRVADSFVANYHFSLPSFIERQQIANFLDHETAKIDALIEKQQQLIKLLKEKRQAVISHAVTKGLNPTAPMKDSGVEWLGEVPEAWDVTEIRYVTSQIGGGTPSKDRVEYWNGDIPWVSPKDMKVDYIEESQDNITEQALDNCSAKLVPLGSVLIVVRGMILIHSVPVALTQKILTINQDMKALVPAKTLSGDYLLVLLKGFRDFILDLVDSSAHGTKCLRTELFERMKVAIPTIEEQEAILSQLRQKLQAIDSLIDNAYLAVELLQERRTALISAAVTGKIDVRHWKTP